MPFARYTVAMRQRVVPIATKPQLEIRPRPVIARPTIGPRPAIREERPPVPLTDIDDEAPQAEAGAYEDYRRVLTAAGGILIIYKDLDLRWRYMLWRIAAWSAFTGFELWITQNLPDRGPGWLAYLGLLAAGVLNWLILRKPVEVLRRIEIRPDCLILEGTDVFWRRTMEGKPPSLQPDAEGNQVLVGIYGTRHVEFATLRRFDEYDRAPEVFAAHIEDAFAQLWSRDI